MNTSTTWECLTVISSAIVTPEKGGKGLESAHGRGHPQTVHKLYFRMVSSFAVRRKLNENVTFGISLFKYNPQLLISNGDMTAAVPVCNMQTFACAHWKLYIGCENKHSDATFC